MRRGLRRFRRRSFVSTTHSGWRWSSRSTSTTTGCCTATTWPATMFSSTMPTCLTSRISTTMCQVCNDNSLLYYHITTTATATTTAAMAATCLTASFIVLMYCWLCRVCCFMIYTLIFWCFNNCELITFKTHYHHFCFKVPLNSDQATFFQKNLCDQWHQRMFAAIFFRSLTTIFIRQVGVSKRIGRSQFLFQQSIRQSFLYTL